MRYEFTIKLKPCSQISAHFQDPPPLSHSPTPKKQKKKKTSTSKEMETPKKNESCRECGQNLDNVILYTPPGSASSEAENLMVKKLVKLFFGGGVLIRNATGKEGGVKCSVHASSLEFFRIVT